MTHRLAIINPPEADCFSFAALSAANENNIFLCDLCGSSEAPQGRDLRYATTGGEYFLNLFRVASYKENATYFVLPLVTGVNNTHLCFSLFKVRL